MTRRERRERAVVLAAYAVVVLAVLWAQVGMWMAESGGVAGGVGVGVGGDVGGLG